MWKLICDMLDDMVCSVLDFFEWLVRSGLIIFVVFMMGLIFF
ncbi:hypothetical protein PPRY_a1543 [Pseudoalteromonas prydzensis ACAM 620]|nr:hypothetical protein [Pseudoalteromonas prydzensis ACAM 620]